MLLAVDEISLKVTLSVELCHLVTLPVIPLTLKSAGVLPEQIVWLADAVPPTLVGLTVIVTTDELADEQTPL